MSVLELHATNLEKSTTLSGWYVPNMIAPVEVVRVLNAAGVRFMLVGLHGISGWLHSPRATEDVDIVVGLRGEKKAVRILLAAFPNLEADGHDIVTRLRDRESKAVVIDVIKPHEPLFRVALKHKHTIETEGVPICIPSLELALAMKFAAMISLNRADEKKYQDAHDFILMVKSNASIDLEKLLELGQLVYDGGGTEIVEKVRQVRAGERMKL